MNGMGPTVRQRKRRGREEINAQVRSQCGSRTQSLENEQAKSPYEERYHGACQPTGPGEAGTEGRCEVCAQK